MRLEEIQRGQTLSGIALDKLVSVVVASRLVDGWRQPFEWTGRYIMIQALGVVRRDLLLMAATPHNGVEENPQVLLALDSNRFYAAGAHG